MAKKKKISKAERKKIAIAQEAINARDKMEQEMLNNELYIISVNEEGTPFLVNDQYVLLYFRKELADEAAQGFNKIYGEGKLHTFKLENNMRFFEMMWSYAIPEFIIDGDSNIYNIGTYFSLSKKPNNKSKRLEIIQKQPNRKSAPLSKKIEIKEWFSVFSTISFICGIGASIIWLIWDALKLETASPLVFILPLAGIISGVIAVNGAHKQFVKSELGTVFGIALSVLGFFMFFGIYA